MVCGALVSLFFFNLYVNDTPSCSHHVSLAVYTDDMACQPLLHMNYMGMYLSTLQHWLQNWRITITVSKTTVVLFVHVVSGLQKPQPVQMFG
jgi:hypothetical protein